MKSRNKQNRLLILMILSQALLVVFVLQWLRSQYRTEKNRLTGELIAFYYEAQDQVVDTLIFRSYVSPVLSRSETQKSQIKGVVSFEGDNNRVMVNVQHGIDSVHQHEDDSIQWMPDTVRIRRRTDDMLLRSVKMIISHSDSTQHGQPMIKELGLKPDTAAFKTHFHKQLADAGMEFNLTMINDPADSNMRKAIYLAPLNPFSLPPVAIGKYRNYLTAKLFPQLSFGILLICLTALAFMLAWRSLRDHTVLNNLRNEFISNMTHELKTPVASIRLALESLRKFNPGNDPATMEEYLKLAVSENQRLEALVNRVLDHSLLEGESQALNLAETEINSLIMGVVSTMQSRLNNNGRISFHHNEEKLITMCDPLLLKGVIMNLLDNSIKYSDSVPEINVSCMVEKGMINIEVADNGPGISPEYRDKIFEKFFRIPSGNIHNVKGYGLGLSYASLVMKLHKGSIGVVNLSKGCAFTIYLPIM